MDTLITLATDSGAPGAAGAVWHALRPDVRPATVRSLQSPIVARASGRVDGARLGEEAAMYKHILIPTDGSALSEEAIRQGVAVAKSINATVTAVTVSPSFHTVSRDTMMVSDTREQYQKDSHDRAEHYLVFAREIARSSGVPCESAHVVNDHPYEGIIDAARTKGCDLIFMASHGRKGVAALVLGSETTKVLTHSKIPTLVCR